MKVQGAIMPAEHEVVPFDPKRCLPESYLSEVMGLKPETQLVTTRA